MSYSPQTARKVLQSLAKLNDVRDAFTVSNLTALLYISSNKSTTIKDLSNILDLSYIGAAKMVDRLSQKKFGKNKNTALVQKYGDPLDARQILVELTKDGEGLVSDFLKDL